MPFREDVSSIRSLMEPEFKRGGVSVFGGGEALTPMDLDDPLVIARLIRDGRVIFTADWAKKDDGKVRFFVSPQGFSYNPEDDSFYRNNQTTPDDAKPYKIVTDPVNAIVLSRAPFRYPDSDPSYKVLSGDPKFEVVAVEARTAGYTKTLVRIAQELHAAV